jgi:hypothetical protein
VNLHEETWWSQRETVVLVDEDRRERKQVVLYTTGCVEIARAYPYGETAERTLARMRLAAKAPEMVRMLLALEGAGSDATHWCPACGKTQTEGHHARCGLDALLREAGVR